MLMRFLFCLLITTSCFASSPESNNLDSFFKKIGITPTDTIACFSNLTQKNNYIQYYSITETNLDQIYNDVVIHDSLLSKIYEIKPDFFNNHMLIDTAYNFSLYKSTQNIIIEDSLVFLSIPKKDKEKVNGLFENILYKKVEDLGLKGGEFIVIKANIIKQENTPLYISINIKNKTGASFFYKTTSTEKLKNGPIFIKLPSYITDEDVVKIYFQNSNRNTFNYNDLNCLFIKQIQTNFTKPINIPCAKFGEASKANLILEWNKTDAVKKTDLENDYHTVPGDSGLTISYRCSLFEVNIDSSLDYFLDLNFNQKIESSFEIRVQITNKRNEIKYEKILTMKNYKPNIWNNLNFSEEVTSLSKDYIFTCSLTVTKNTPLELKKMCLSIKKN